MPPVVRGSGLAESRRRDLGREQPQRQEKTRQMTGETIRVRHGWSPSEMENQDLAPVRRLPVRPLVGIRRFFAQRLVMRSRASAYWAPRTVIFDLRGGAFDIAGIAGRKRGMSESILSTPLQGRHRDDPVTDQEAVAASGGTPTDAQREPGCHECRASVCRERNVYRWTLGIHAIHD